MAGDAAGLRGLNRELSTVMLPWAAHWQQSHFVSIEKPDVLLKWSSASWKFCTSEKKSVMFMNRLRILPTCSTESLYSQNTFFHLQLLNKC